jgi:hypothetical protein
MLQLLGQFRTKPINALLGILDKPPHARTSPLLCLRTPCGTEATTSRIIRPPRTLEVGRETWLSEPFCVIVRHGGWEERTTMYTRWRRRQERTKTACHPSTLRLAALTQGKLVGMTRC